MAAPVVDPKHGTVRGLRALVLAVVAVGVAGSAHTFVDGCIDTVGLALSLGLCWPMAVALLGRRRSTGALLAWCAAAQVSTHVLVALTCGGSEHIAPARVLAAHGAAVLVTGALLARGDEGLWAAHALRRAIRLVALPTAPTAVVPVLALTRPEPRDVLLLRSLWQARPSPVRGPPSAPC